MANDSRKQAAPKAGRANKAPAAAAHETRKPREAPKARETEKPHEAEERYVSEEPHVVEHLHQSEEPVSVVTVSVIRTTKGDKAMSSETHNGSPVLNGVKAAGEAFAFPGASLILDGNVKSGATHLAGATLARVLIGPIGWFAFAADSFSKSVTGKSLYSHFSGETIKL